MPLYEFECVKCRDNVENSLKAIEGSKNNKTAAELVKKFKNIHAIEVVDLDKEKVLAKHGKKGKDAIFQDFYLNEGSVLVLFNLQTYRFSELIYDKDDEKNVKCSFFSSFLS